MHFVAYISNIYTQIALGSLAITCTLCWWKGGVTEQLGAAALAVTVVGTHLFRILSDQLIPTEILFGSDAILAVSFLVIAVRYGSLWVGTAMLFQAPCFALHAIQLGDDDAPRWHGMIVYLLLNNILYYLVQLALSGGAIGAMLGRMRERKENAAAAAKQAALSVVWKNSILLGAGGRNSPTRPSRINAPLAHG